MGSGIEAPWRPRADQTASTDESIRSFIGKNILYCAPMRDPQATANDVNDPLEAGAPALLRALSPFGRRAYFPPDIPAQSAQARGKGINGTIGQITDGRGGA